MTLEQVDHSSSGIGIAVNNAIAPAWRSSRVAPAEPKAGPPTANK